MLLMNYGKLKSPYQQAKGVDKHSTDIQPARPMFNEEPFDNHFDLMHQNESLMGFNQYGNFTANTIIADAHKFGVSTMNNNLSLINLMNSKRRGEF